MSRPPSVHKHMTRVSLAARLPISVARLAVLKGPDVPEGDQYVCRCGALLIVNEGSTPRKVYHKEPGCPAFVRSASLLGRRVDDRAREAQS